MKVFLFHCSAGKDRTGIIIRLLLELVGCYDHDIVKDYSESYANNHEIIEALKEMMDEDTENFLTSSPRYMTIFFRLSKRTLWQCQSLFIPYRYV